MYQKNRHEQLQASDWDEARVRDVICQITADAEQQWNDYGYWSIHPLDKDFTPPVPSYQSLYEGAAGVLWALHYLHQAQAIALDLDPVAIIPQVYNTYLRAPDTDEVVPSFFLGEVGIALVHWRLAPNPDVARRLFEQVQANISNPTNEALWAAPGTMLAALWMGQWTGEAHWIKLYRRNVDYLWQQWQYSADWDCYLWTQDLYGSISQMSGPAHGYAGNLYALLRGVEWLSSEQQELYERAVQLVVKTAQVEGNIANWCPQVARPCPEPMLVQWCHGAPGMVTSMAHYPVGISESLDMLLVQAGELTWQAGPLKKGPGLCHGTAGNGYAFLKLYHRTQKEYWLERARQFAMHAIDQYRQAKKRYVLGRYSLWTGDLGLAVYLWHCITAEADLPSLDIV